ncbi:MAG: hypothetical protein EU550_02210 [Promethearchaeota archaeon]|nr:MAG: hypothetical protein EU550_02210 [Candidatus Lokiarchaeota archaeon]
MKEIKDTGDSSIRLLSFSYDVRYMNCVFIGAFIGLFSAVLLYLIPNISQIIYQLFYIIILPTGSSSFLLLKWSYINSVISAIITLIEGFVIFIISMKAIKPILNRKHFEENL